MMKNPWIKDFPQIKLEHTIGNHMGHEVSVNLNISAD